MLPPNHVLQNRYRILRPLGQGGMGHVYAAMDDAVDCVVAIKETSASTDRLRRAFEREAKLLANLRHPALPRVTHHFVEGDGQFLVMDHIDGLNLAELLSQRGRPFTADELSGAADRLLDALNYLHTRSEPVIHRDIKPANIKVASNGDIYLLDFGLAKGTAGQMPTVEPGDSVFSSVFGYTAAYAPLEQLTNAGTNAQSDLYGLGATLYHLFTGQPPLSASVRYEAIEMDAGDPLPTIHQLNPGIPPAVSDVIAKAMAMSRRDRTKTAAEMQQALRAAMNAAPVLVPADGASAQAPTVIIPPAMEAPLSVETSWPSQINPSEAPAAAPTEAATADMRERFASPASPKHVPTMVVGAPAKAEPISRSSAADLSFPAPENKHRMTRIMAATAAIILLLVGGFFVWKYTLSPNTKTPSTSAAAPTPTKAAPPNYTFVRDLQKGQGVVWTVSYSPDGRYLAAAGDGKQTNVWTAPDFVPLTRAWAHLAAVNSIAFSSDGKLLASAGNDRSTNIWSVEASVSTPVHVEKFPDEIYFVAFSPDATRLAIAGKDKLVRIFDLQANSVSATLEGHTDVVWSVGFSPDGKLLASASKDKTVRVWHQLDGGWESRILSGHTSAVISVAFSPDGKVLASGSDDNTVKLWDTTTWAELKTLKGHTSFITSLAYSPDGRTLASASNDGTIVLWDTQTYDPRQILKGHTKSVTSVCFSPDGKTIVSGGRDETIKLWQ